MSKSKSLNVVTSDSDQKWRAESDLDTLMRAAEIKADAKRLKAAMAVAEERQQQLNGVKEEVVEDAAEANAKK